MYLQEKWRLGLEHYGDELHKLLAGNHKTFTLKELEVLFGTYSGELHKLSRAVNRLCHTKFSSENLVFHAYEFSDSGFAKRKDLFNSIYGMQRKVMQDLHQQQDWLSEPTPHEDCKIEVLQESLRNIEERASQCSCERYRAFRIMMADVKDKALMFGYIK